MAFNNLKDGIVVYCTKGNIMFSNSGELIENKHKKIRKHKVSRTIIFSIFDEIKEFNDNEFWDKFLTKCSKNNFPRNFKFSNEILNFRSKAGKQNEDFYMDKKDLKKTFEDLKVFLKDKGILPFEEKLEILSEPVERNNVKWKDFGKNQINLTYEYIEATEEKYNLNEDEKNNLISLLKFGITGDIFNDDTITIEYEKIKKINHLLWDEEKRVFKIDINNIKLKIHKSINNSTSNVYGSFIYNNSSKNESPEWIQTQFEKLDVTKLWGKFLTNFK